MQDRTPMATMFDTMMAMNRTYFDFWAKAWSFPGRELVPYGQSSTQSYAGRDRDQEVIAVGEESLDVSTRRVYGATTRVKRVVRTVPVERRVELRDETITVERRVQIGEPADDEALSEHEYVMSESREVPVINKQRRVRELVVLRKHSTPRVEVIRDVVRRADVQVEQPERTLVVMAQNGGEESQGHQYRESETRDASRGEDGSGLPSQEPHQG